MRRETVLLCTIINQETTPWAIKRATFFQDNFGKYGPILKIRSLLYSEMNLSTLLKTGAKLTTSRPLNVLPHYLVKVSNVQLYDCSFITYIGRNNPHSVGS